MCLREKGQYEDVIGDEVFPSINFTCQLFSFLLNSQRHNFLLSLNAWCTAQESVAAPFLKIPIKSMNALGQDSRLHVEIRRYASGSSSRIEIL